MNYLVALLVGTLITSTAFSSTSVADAKEVYEHLIAANHITFAPPLYIIKDNSVNAFSSSNKIGINTGMLRYTRNRDELARVLGHELGHKALHHEESNVPNEYAADRMAAIYMRGAGYDVCKGAALLKRRGSNGGSNHPADIDRYRAFHCSN